MPRFAIVLTLLGTFVFWGMTSTPARADWNPNDFAKWVQLPDWTGFDVNATWKGSYPFVKVLADDWKCTSHGPVTDVHIWGSWLYDEVFPDASFKLSIHRDVPAGVDAPYSHPDYTAAGMLWQTIVSPTQYTRRLDPNVPQGLPERFYDPNTNQIIGQDSQIFQYNFVNLPNPFLQQGTPLNPVIYWLDVQVLVPTGAPYVFGWKTSRDPHQLDDAVFGDTAAFGGPVSGPMTAPPFWAPMVYPGPTEFHPAGESMDMAFVITPEPGGAMLGGIVVLLLARRRR